MNEYVANWWRHWKHLYVTCCCSKRTFIESDQWSNIQPPRACPNLSRRAVNRYQAEHLMLNTAHNFLKPCKSACVQLGLRRWVRYGKSPPQRSLGRVISYYGTARFRLFLYWLKAAGYGRQTWFEAAPLAVIMQPGIAGFFFFMPLNVRWNHPELATLSLSWNFKVARKIVTKIK